MSDESTAAASALRSGDLDDALAKLQQDVRANPADPKLRVFLFELLSLLGDWDRAGTQLDVVAEMDEASLAMVHQYRDVLLCEKFRAEAFAGGRSPIVFGEPEPWVAQLMEVLGAADSELLAQRLDAVFEQTPALSGSINDEPFEYLGDADARLGPVLEVMMNGNYYWIPFFRISKMLLAGPEKLRDRVWMPVEFIWSNGGEGFGMVPTRYIGSEGSESPQIRDGRLTEWQDKGEGYTFGVGQRILTTDQDDYPIMDVREVTIHAPE